MSPITIHQQLTHIVSDPRDYLTLVYGDAGVGKTTFASQIPGHYFIITEAGTHGVEIFGHQIFTWDDFLETLALIVEQRDRGWKDTEGNSVREVHTIVIDDVEHLFWSCGTYLCQTTKFIDNGVLTKYDRIEDVSWGKGFKRACEYLLKPLNKMLLKGFGIVLTGHVKTRSIKWRGQDMTHYSIGLPPSVAQALIDACGAVGYMTIEETQIKDKDQNIIATENERRCYWQKQFLLECKHKLANMPNYTLLNNNPAKGPTGWENYLTAFNNAVLATSIKIETPNEERKPMESTDTETVPKT